MTRLFNLESYPEICKYTQIFGESLSLNSPNIPFAYRDFLNTYKDRHFLSPANLSSYYSNTIVRGEYKPQFLGDQLDDQQEGDLVIVRDIDVLSLQNLDCPYIYASAYRYWNYVTQLQNIAKENKPLVIYDLDSLPCSYYLPISFQSHPNCSYSIPILDIRTPENYESLRLPFDPSNVYDTICEILAQYVIASDPNFVGIESSYLTQYLKKINVFNIIKNCLISNPNQEIVSLLIDFSNVDNTNLYLKAELPLTIVENIVSSVILVPRLKEIVQNNCEYNFVLISQYNCLSNFRFSLESHFFLPDISHSEFSKIWQEKQSQEFPLYGQFLDLITFQLANQISINVPSESERTNICYEGERKFHTFIGKYTVPSGETKSSFLIDKPQVILPIKINGKTITKNQIEQVYMINNQFFEKVSSLSVEIHFSLMLGKPLLLEIFEVLSEQKLGHKLNAKLGDRPEIKLGFIPIQNIIEGRQIKENNAVTNLCLNSKFTSSFPKGLDEIIRALHAYINQSSKNIKLRTDLKLSEMEGIVRSNYLSLFKNDALQHISPDSNNDIANEIIKKIKSSEIRLLLEKALLMLGNHRKKAVGKESGQIFNIYNDNLLLIGKQYKIAAIQDFDFLFDYLKNSCNLSEHVKVIARISYNSNFQQKYFSLFETHLPKNNNNNFYYEYDSYLWGYARILMWYLDYNLNETNILLFKRHFNLIASHALSDHSRNSYYQDALISLIYLLSFREFDSTFCEIGSLEYNLGIKLCEKLSFHPVLSKQVDINKSLNQIFYEFLNGTATGDDMDNLIKAEFK